MYFDTQLFIFMEIECVYVNFILKLLIMPRIKNIKMAQKSLEGNGASKIRWAEKRHNKWGIVQNLQGFA
jgi:hypothetical protein